MILLDAYALVALVADDPAAGEVEELLRGGDCGVVVANLTEAIDISARVHGLPASEVRSALEPLLGDALTVLVSGEQEAWLAAELRARYYDRKTCALSLADCLLLGHALVEGDLIATADPPLAGAARNEGLGVAALPDSTGTKP